MKKSRLFTLLAILVAACLLLPAVYYFSGRGPSALLVHVEGDWTQVTVTSEANRESPLKFDSSAKQIKAEPIGYGPYVMQVQFKDGKNLWLECFHTDAGMAKTIDIIVNRQANSDQVNVKAACAYRNSRPQVDFERDIAFDQTSAQLPCRVWGGP